MVVAGDALVDLTPVATAAGSPGYEPHPGGSSLNVAVGLARLGVPAALLARISSDAFGQLLHDHLDSSGVLPGCLISTDDLTTLAAVHLRDGQATYSFHAEGAADRGLLPGHLAGLPDDAIPAGAALHLGSIALVLEPVASTLEGLLRRESGHRLISLDPNIRPSLIIDRAAYVRRFAQWTPLVDVLKVSEDDVAWLCPGRSEDDVVDEWLAAGVSLVVITHGDRGARASTPGASAKVPAPQVTVVDTVGAGDAFTSGLLAHLHDRGRLTRGAVRALDTDGLTELLTAASRIAADTCRRAGAEPPYREAVLAGLLPGPQGLSATTADLVERARALAGSGHRTILGITGAPGAGKTTLSREIVDRLGPDLAVLVPMDGFHLSNATLRSLGRRGRKGAHDTFDADGYVQLLRRLRDQAEDVVHAPDFDRDIDESIGSAVPIRHDVPLVVTEGNYLLLERGSWAHVLPFLDESWYLLADDHTRQERLGARHQRHGMSPQDALTWARTTDQENAAVVDQSRDRADYVITILSS